MGVTARLLKQELLIHLDYGLPFGDVVVRYRGPLGEPEGPREQAIHLLRARIPRDVQQELADRRFRIEEPTDRNITLCADGDFSLTDRGDPNATVSVIERRDDRGVFQEIVNGETFAAWLSRKIDKETKVKQEPSWKRRLQGKEA